MVQRQNALDLDVLSILVDPWRTTYHRGFSHAFTVKLAAPVLAAGGPLKIGVRPIFSTMVPCDLSLLCNAQSADFHRLHVSTLAIY